ncbi:trypsin-like peptidase domain-containing protein [Gloeobacter violaceus]|nr:trypsin-like peptidase domain-containing protein [Gloeobacter violaceus]
MLSHWKKRLVQLAVVGAVAGGSFSLGTFAVRQVAGVPLAAAPAPQASLTSSDSVPLPALSSAEGPQRASAATTFLGPNFIADAAEKASPAVVRINTERVREVGGRTPLEQFFPEFTPRRGGMPRLEQGAGSGFILSGDGTVVTNAHVVEKADKVYVTLGDGRKTTGKVIGADPLTDIAVIKIDAGIDLPTAPLGDSDRLRAGEWVIAVGNPLGLDHTVTAGIISALKRSSNEVGVREDRRLDFIQTDAAINPGNSGGPLVNIYGQVVGINTAIRADGQGIGFAIPINKVKEITASLLRDGRVIRPYIGISMVSITPELLRELKENPDVAKLPQAEKGVWIREVIKGSPAATAGLRADDIIVEVDGKAVSEARQVQELIGARKVGDTVSVSVQRNSKLSTFEVRTVELSQTPLS